MNCRRFRTFVYAKMWKHSPMDLSGISLTEGSAEGLGLYWLSQFPEDIVMLVDETQI